MEDPTTSTYTRYFRLTAALVHIACAIFFLAELYTTNCPSLVSMSFYSAYYSGEPDAFAVQTASSSCVGLEGWKGMWCQASMIPQQWDVRQDLRSFTPGASWNVLAIVVVFEWITASYSLVYTEEPAVLWAMLPMPPGVQPQPFIASVWNIVLICVLWAGRRTLHVPDNNLFVFTGLLLASILKQNYLARMPPAPLKANAAKSQDEATVVKVQWKTEHFIRERKRKPSDTPQPNDSLHLRNYQQHLDRSGEAVVARLMLYIVIAPLGLMLLLLLIDGTAQTWVFQVTQMSLVCCLCICPVMHYAAVLQKSTEDVDKLMRAGQLALLACALGYLSAFTVLLYYAQTFLFVSPANSGMQTWVFVLMWFCVFIYTCYGAVTTLHYLPSIFAGADIPSNQNLTAFYDHCCLIITMTIAWTIYVQWIQNCAPVLCGTV